MAFDQTTRNRLARFVSDTRALLTEEFTRQLQNDYGLDPATGEVTDVARLSHLDDARRETARLLRDTMEHYLASADTATPAKAKKARQDVLDRILREQAFTVLNRLCALRMAEARGLLIESIAKGYQSKGFQLYQRLAGTALGETGAAYRLFLFSGFDEFAVDLAVLFDRFSPQGRLFPREAALLAVLEQINHPDIDPLWTEDETIGWIYQYFNSLEERRRMRAESQAPRNSRELAVRNQFFTPRYVVEFLTDNTLGRIWYEMTKGDTDLKGSCRYLVRRPNEVFVGEGQQVPEPDEVTESMSQEELLRKPVYILHRPLKDPRDIRMLDPACGSMHFGLYAFDLFERIYDEAWEIEATQGPGVFTRSEGIKPLAETYSCKETFLHDVPRLIIERNIHGIDIDPRAVQIAGLSLWLRAQRSWQAQGVKAQDRPQVRRSNIVCAEPMPGEADMLEEFAGQLQPKVLGQLVRIIFEKMKLAGEAGSILKIEEDIKDAIADAHKEYQEFILQQKKEKGFLPGMAPERQATLFDFADLPKEEDFWHTAEQRVIDALRYYAEMAASDTYQRRLFAADAARGFAFIDLCRKRYDVALMNPPFGLPTASVEEYAKERFENTWQDVYASFYERTLGFTRADIGYVGAITPKSFYHAKGFRGLRKLLKAAGPLSYSVDIGGGVLDAAVEVCFSIVQSRQSSAESIALFCNLVSSEKTLLADKVLGFVSLVKSGVASREIVPVAVVKDVGLPNDMLPYRFPAELLKLLQSSPSFEASSGSSVVGITTFDNDRFIRLSWETTESSRHAKEWLPVAMGGGWDPFYAEFNLVVKWAHEAAEMRANEIRRYGTTARTMQSQRFWYRPGLTFSKISTLGFSTQPFPAGSIFTSVGFCIFADRFDNWTWLGYFNSKPVCCLMSLFSADRHWHSNSVAFLPVPAGMSSNVAKISKEAFAISVELLGQSSETAPEFVRCDIELDVDEKADVYQKLTQDLSSEISTAFGLSASTLEFLFANAIYAERDFSVSPKECAKRQFSYFLGCVFGRWEIRYATGKRQPPPLPDPFDPLPVCPPGMLQNSEGLPAESKDVPADYPLRISWPGILVDDNSNPEDIAGRVREAIEVIWKERAEAIEQDACEILGVKTLRDYFQRPASFFADHLQRYSKSRRAAPIYWPLTTHSGSYTLWLYYQRLTDQTLYTCVNDFVEPKLKQVADEAARLRTKTARSSAEEKDLERLSNLDLELKDFRDELLRIARFWKPNLNDGVQITAAPLWRLFQHRQWQARLRETWEKLEAGDYDWAHLALSIWPDRVVRASHKDHSYAIAHDLEDRLWHEVEVTKKTKGGKVKKTTEWQPRDLTEADLKTIIAEVQAR